MAQATWISYFIVYVLLSSRAEIQDLEHDLEVKKHRKEVLLQQRNKLRYFDIKFYMYDHSLGTWGYTQDEKLYARVNHI